VIPDGGPAAVFVSIFIPVAVVFWWVWAPLLGVSIGFALLAREGHPAFIAALIAPAVLLLVGVALHESAHVYAYRLLSGNRSGGRLVVGRTGAGIERPRLVRHMDEVVVSCAGPLVPGAIGAAVVFVAWPSHSVLLGMYGSLLAIHLMCLAPWWSDGKAAVQSVQSLSPPHPAALPPTSPAGGEVKP